MYLPCDRRTPDSIFTYDTILGELQFSIDILNTNKVISMGDYNADPNKGNLWPYIKDFFLNNNFIVNDLFLPIDTFTYIS